MTDIPYTFLFELTTDEARDLYSVYLGHSGGTTPEMEALGDRLLNAVKEIEARNF